MNKKKTAFFFHSNEIIRGSMTGAICGRLESCSWAAIGMEMRLSESQEVVHSSQQCPVEHDVPIKLGQLQAFNRLIYSAGPCALIASPMMFCVEEINVSFLAEMEVLFFFKIKINLMNQKLNFLLSNEIIGLFN